MATLAGYQSRAPAFNALASFDMQDDFRFAVPAEYREAVGAGIGVHMQQPPVAAADWARHPSIRYDQFTTCVVLLQGLSLTFLLIWATNQLYFKYYF